MCSRETYHSCLGAHSQCSLREGGRGWPGGCLRLRGKWILIDRGRRRRWWWLLTLMSLILQTLVTFCLCFNFPAPSHRISFPSFPSRAYAVCFWGCSTCRRRLLICKMFFYYSTVNRRHLSWWILTNPKQQQLQPHSKKLGCSGKPN